MSCSSNPLFVHLTIYNEYGILSCTNLRLVIWRRRTGYTMVKDNELRKIKSIRLILTLSDLCGGQIVSWIVIKNNDNLLVMKTLHKTLDKNPGATPILHSDRVFQYTSKEYTVRCRG